jgi:DNA gyrase subunit A
VELEEGDGNLDLSPNASRNLQAKEQFMLTVIKGFGKRTSAYEYRLSGAAGRASPIWA